MVKCKVKNILFRNIVFKEGIDELFKDDSLACTPASDKYLDLLTFKIRGKPMKIGGTLFPAIELFSFPPWVQCIIDGLHGTILLQIEDIVKKFRLQSKV